MVRRKVKFDHLLPNYCLIFDSNISGYHAPMEVYGELYKASSDPSVHRLAPDKNVNVCVGKEWYRFPSSFFLPSNR